MIDSEDEQSYVKPRAIIILDFHNNLKFIYAMHDK